MNLPLLDKPSDLKRGSKILRDCLDQERTMDERATKVEVEVSVQEPSRKGLVWV